MSSESRVSQTGSKEDSQGNFKRDKTRACREQGPTFNRFSDTRTQASQKSNAGRLCPLQSYYTDPLAQSDICPILRIGQCRQRWTAEVYAVHLIPAFRGNDDVQLQPSSLLASCVDQVMNVALKLHCALDDHICGYREDVFQLRVGVQVEVSSGHLDNLLIQGLDAS